MQDERIRLVRAIDKGIDFVAAGMASLVGLIVVFVAGSICYEVIVRYIFNAPTSWVYNFSSVLVAGVPLLGSAWALRQNKHICVDVLVHRLPERSRLAVEVLGEAFVAVYAAIFAYEAFIFVKWAYLGKMRVVGYIPIQEWPFRAALFIGAAMLALVAVRGVISKCKKVFSRNSWKGEGKWANPILPVSLFAALLAAALLILTFGNQEVGIIMLVVVLLFGGIPIFAGLGFIAIFCLPLIFQMGFFEIVRTSWHTLTAYALVCLPLFMLGGQLMAVTGQGEKLFDVARLWLGRLPGGLGVATIAACALFSAVCGSSVATTATIGVVSIPYMLSRGYRKGITYGAAAGGGLLGIMIPPSGVFIIYSAMTDEGIADLFMAGVVPGIILALLFMLYIVFACLKRGEEEKPEPVSWGKKVLALGRILGPIGAVVIVFGGIYGGVFTPIEASGIFVGYIFVIGLMDRSLTLRTTWEALATSMSGVVMIMIIIAGAMSAGIAMILLDLPQRLVSFVAETGLSLGLVVTVMMVVWIIMGLFMEGVAILLITVPLFYPAAMAMGMNGILFGVILVLAIELALITPPVGLNLFVVQGIAKAKSGEVIRSIVPYTFILLGMVVILYFFPQIALWLPSKLK